MKRFLPPLLLLVVFGAIGVRCAMDPYRAEAQAQIAGYLLGGERERATEELERYLERYTGVEDQWFASRTWFRLQMPERGIRAIWDHPTLPAQPGTSRRFAASALRALGWEDEAQLDRTALEPLALIVLVEGHEAWAEERLREHARELEVKSTTAYYFPAYQRATRHPLDVMTAVYRSRKDERLQVAAALGALHAEPYPERAADLARLKRVVSEPERRRTFREVWAVSCVALGRSGDEDAQAVLNQTAASLEGSAAARDQADLLLVRNGQLAGGNWDIEPDLAREMFKPHPPPTALVWYVEALIHRYRLGDMRSELRLRQIWYGPGAIIRPLRHRIARAFLLQDTPPRRGGQGGLGRADAR